MTPDEIAKLIWKTVEDYPDYEVSTCGQVRSTKAIHGRSGKVLKGIIRGKGYFAVTLYQNGLRHNVPIHQLVLTAFAGKRPEGMIANHKNGNKLDNCIENLEWVTHRENVLHAYRTGLAVGSGPTSENSPAGKLTEKQAKEILRKSAEGFLIGYFRTLTRCP